MLSRCLRQAPPFPASRFRGRGIVVCGGGPHLVPAWVCIHMVRHMGCRLPIELWHLGPEELREDMARLLAPLGVRCVDARQVAVEHPAPLRHGWELKPYAIINSAFEEVLLLDADNVPIVDVTPLFEWPEYRQCGAVFWPDFGRLARHRAIWRICSVRYRDEPGFESGQILLDKRRSWTPLMLVMHMNERSDFYYQHILGDKETFHMAWRRCGAEYAMPPHAIKPLPGTMCQHDFAGSVIFQHRNMVKWTLTGNVRVPGFQLEDLCLELVARLRNQWPGESAPGEKLTAGGRP